MGSCVIPVLSRYCIVALLYWIPNLLMMLWDEDDITKGRMKAFSFSVEGYFRDMTLIPI